MIVGWWFRFLGYAVAFVVVIDYWLDWSRTTGFALRNPRLYLAVSALMLIWVALLMRWAYKRSVAVIPA